MDPQDPEATPAGDERAKLETAGYGRNATSLTLLLPAAVLSMNDGSDQGQTKTFSGAITVFNKRLAAA